MVRDIENFTHRQKVILRKRQIELQKLDNEIESEPVPLPKYVKPPKIKKSAGLWNFVKKNIYQFKP